MRVAVAAVAPVPDDFNLTLTIERSGKKEMLTIGELLDLGQPWRKFGSNARVSAAGPFSVQVSLS